MDFAIPPDYWVKIKENEKINKYSDLAWEMKKRWKLIPIVVSELGMAPGSQLRLDELEICGRIETIQIIRLRSA